MKLKRFELHQTQVGADMRQRDDGEWCDADDAQAEIDRLKKEIQRLEEDLRYSLRFQGGKRQAREPEPDGNGKCYLFE